MKQGHAFIYRRIFILWLVGAVSLGCGVPLASGQQLVLLPSTELETLPSSPFKAADSSSSVTPMPVSRLETKEVGSTPRVVTITISSEATKSNVTVTASDNALTVAPTPLITTSTDISETNPVESEPIIFTGVTSDQRCGHGEVVAIDGHSLRATPRILGDNSNFYERLPEGTRVDLIDCRLWTNQELQTWVAVRTATGKLGWMLVQPDSFYITIYPIALDPPFALTGIPAGTTIAYVPPSKCKSGSTSTDAVATSIGIDLIPVVGDAKGVAEAATGCDLVTGESLGDWRWFGLLGVVGLNEATLLRHSDEVAGGIRVADNLDDAARHADEIGLGIGKHTDDASDLLRGVGKVDGVINEGTDTARVVNSTRSAQEMAALVAAKFEQPCSFAADTPVSTQVGPTPISLIKPGDLVLSYHESMGVTGYYTVTNVFTHLDEEIIRLTIGTDEIETTPEHPFLVGEQWIPAASISIGDDVFSASKTAGHVEDVEVFRQNKLMYNLTVAEAHTYFVGTQQWLVHNGCSRILRSNLQSAPDFPRWTEGLEWQAHHVIPQQLEGHPFVVRATDEEWIDDAANGVALPVSEVDGNRLGLPTHRGPHGQYTSQVEAELNALEDRAARESWSDQRAKRELENLVQRLKQNIFSQGAGQRLN